MKPLCCILQGVTFAATALAAPAAEVPNTLLHTINAPPVGVQVGALFGGSVAIDGGYTVVGIPWDDSTGNQRGLVKVFDSSSGALRYVLRNPRPIPFTDHFGLSVAISGTRVAVGALYFACVYDLTSATPGVPIAIVPQGIAARGFGPPVAISGTTLVVGGPEVGKAYVYELTSATPTDPVVTLTKPDVVGFGGSVAISGTKVVVGNGKSWRNEGFKGSAFVFDLTSATPNLPVATLNDPGPNNDGRFGISLAMSGDRLVVGVEPPPGGTAKVYVFDLSSGTPAVPIAVLPHPSSMPADDQFATTVAISGARVVVGAPGSDTDALNAGTIFVYDLDSATPTVPMTTLNNPAPAVSDQFGYAVAASGARVVVSAPWDDTDGFETGSVYIYDLIGGIPPVPMSVANGPGPVPGDHFGASVAVSGTRVAVGAPDEDTGATNAGSVYVYDVGSRTPTVPVVTLHNPTPAAGDQFGRTVVIGGTHVAVGVVKHNDNAGSGSIFVYDISAAEPALPVVTVQNPSPGSLGFGRALAMSGTRLVVGASGDHTDGRDRGRVYVYDLVSGTPAVPVITLKSPFPSDVVEFGRSVGISGTRLVVSARGLFYFFSVFDLSGGNPTVPEIALDNPSSHLPYDTSLGISGTHGVLRKHGESAVYVYDLQGATPSTPMITLNQNLGWGAAISGPIVLMGGGNEKSAFIFDLSTSMPAVPAATIPNPNPNTEYPHPLAIDGPIVAIGSPFDDTVTLDKGAVHIYAPSSPELVVETEPAQTPLVDGGSQSVGSVFVNGTSSLSYSIRNIGATALTGLATSIDGPNAADFTITSGPVAPVSGPGGSTSFTVRFSPSSLGVKTATLHIASNDADESPFDITLTGTGIEPVNRVVDDGSPVVFSVDAPAGATVQWRKDGVDIPGAVGSTLTFGAVRPWQIGVYSARVTTAAGASVRDVASLGLTDVPSGIWRGLVACYRFDGSAADFCRPDQPASFKHTSGLGSDPRRGGVARVQGKGSGVPPLAGEPPELQGPGGYIQIPKPPLGEGEPFTVSFAIKEEGFSHWHGESLVTIGEAGPTLDLIGHYWIGSLHNTEENYGGPGGPVELYTSNYVLEGDAVALDFPWTTYTVVGDGTTLRLYRDGQLMGTSAYTPVPMGDFFIGRHSWSNGANYSTRLVASVDDLRIFNRALTAPEVQQLFNLVQTTPPLGSFESWALIHGLSGTEADASADPDGDGLSNGDEFRLGTSPTDGTQLPLKATVAGTTLTLEWLGKSGVVYGLKESSSLLNPWTASVHPPVLSADQSGVPAGYTRVQAEVPLPPPGVGATPRFFRVEATGAP